MLVEDTSFLQLISPGDMKLPDMTSSGLHQRFVNSFLISFSIRVLKSVIRLKT